MEVVPGFQATADAEDPKTIISTKERRYQMGKLFVIGIISIATVVLTIVDVTQTVRSFEKKNELIDKVQGSINTAFTIHNLQKERGRTALRFGFQQLDVDEEKLKLKETRKETNVSIKTLENREDANLDDLTGEASSFLVILEEFRRKIDNDETNVIEHLQTYSGWVSSLISILTNYIKSENLQDYANLVYGYQMVILSKEEAGLERALGGMKFAQGKTFSIINTTWYNEKRVLAHNYLQTAFLFSQDAKETYSTLEKKNNNTKVINEIEKRRLILSSASYNDTSEKAAYEWFDLMTKYNNLLLELQIQLADLIEEEVEDEIDESTNQLVIRSLLLCFTLIIVPCIIVSLARVQKRFYQYTLSLFDKVGLEQARTDFIMRENARHVDSELNVFTLCD